MIIWAATGGGFPWFLFPLGGWGIGIFFHFLGAFVFLKGGGDWEKRAIDKEMEKIKRSGNCPSFFTTSLVKPV